MPARSPSSRLLAIVAFGLVSLAGSDASAQLLGSYARYSERFYGQNFYDHQRNGPFVRGIARQYDGGYYGPAMIYGRQYADEYQPPRDQPLVAARRKRGTLYGTTDGAQN